MNFQLDNTTTVSADIIALILPISQHCRLHTVSDATN